MTRQLVICLAVAFGCLAVGCQPEEKVVTETPVEAPELEQTVVSNSPTSVTAVKPTLETSPAQGPGLCTISDRLRISSRYRGIFP